MITGKYADKQVYPNEIEGADMTDYGEVYREWFQYGAAVWALGGVLAIVAMVSAASGAEAKGVLRMTRIA